MSHTLSHRPESHRPATLRSRALSGGLLFLVLGAPAITGCCGKKDRGPEAKVYGAALEAHKDRLAGAVADLAALEQRLAPLRSADPAAAARLLKAEALPLLDRLQTSADEPLAKGKAWLKTVNKASAKRRIERALKAVTRQKEALARLRASYGEELALLERGAPAAADLSRILGSRGIIALQALARPPRPRDGASAPAAPGRPAP